MYLGTELTGVYFCWCIGKGVKFSVKIPRHVFVMTEFRRGMIYIREEEGEGKISVAVW